MDLYNLFSDVVKSANTKNGYTAMYIFGTPDNSIIYIGNSMKVTAAHEADATTQLDLIEKELAMFSNKNIHTASDICNVLQAAYMAEHPEATEPTECPFASYSVTEIEIVKF